MIKGGWSWPSNKYPLSYLLTEWHKLGIFIHSAAGSRGGEGGGRAVSTALLPTQLHLNQAETLEFAE